MVNDTSSTGVHQNHEDGDQRNAPSSDKDKKENDFHQGNAHSHNAFDKMDQRSLNNRAAAEKQRNQQGDREDSEQTKQLKEDPTKPARMHGNKPSRGAEIDAEIQAEEQEELERKGKA